MPGVNPYIIRRGTYRMSKSKPAINDFFQCYRPENETHELAIKQFCCKRHFMVAIDGTPDKRFPVTYDQFRQWFETDTPRRGDVVILPAEGVSGIVETVGVDNTVCLYISLTGKTLNLTSGYFRYTTLEAADEAAILRLQRALYGHGVLWNQWRNRIKLREEPKENVQYQISILGRKAGYGIFREIDTQDRIVMYCLKREGEPVRYSLHEVVGPQSDYQLEPINVGQREELAKELEETGVLWNGFCKRVEPVDYLVPEGKGYYYLDEFWAVCRTIEQGKSKGARYFSGGNYSRYREPLEEIRKYLVNELGISSVSRTEGNEYYYLKEFWKVCKTTDKGRRRDIKRAKAGNYFKTEEAIRNLLLRLQEKRKEQLARYPLKG